VNAVHPKSTGSPTVELAPLYLAAFFDHENFENSFVTQVLIPELE